LDGDGGAGRAGGDGSVSGDDSGVGGETEEYAAHIRLGHDVGVTGLQHDGIADVLGGGDRGLLAVRVRGGRGGNPVRMKDSARVLGSDPAAGRVVVEEGVDDGGHGRIAGSVRNVSAGRRPGVKEAYSDARPSARTASSADAVGPERRRSPHLPTDESCLDGIMIFSIYFHIRST